MITEEQAVMLLKKYSHDEKLLEIVLDHSRKVYELAIRMAEKIPNVNMQLVKVGSLLHDIGRLQTDETIRHGLMSAEILRKEGLPEVAQLAERHLGAGISREEIKEQKLNLPDKDFVPVTVEEKIVTDADNRVDDGGEITIEAAAERYRNEIGEKCVQKVLNLHKELLSMHK